MRCVTHNDHHTYRTECWVYSTTSSIYALLLYNLCTCTQCYIAVKQLRVLVQYSKLLLWCSLHTILGLVSRKDASKQITIKDKDANDVERMGSIMCVCVAHSISCWLYVVRRECVPSVCNCSSFGYCVLVSTGLPATTYKRNADATTYGLRARKM